MQLLAPTHEEVDSFLMTFEERYTALTPWVEKEGLEVAEIAKYAEWWQWTKVVQAFSEMLRARDKKPSLIKRITTIGQPRKEAELTPAELLMQLSLRKRARAFVDARDDLETKIGRLTAGLTSSLPRATCGGRSLSRLSSMPRSSVVRLQICVRRSARSNGRVGPLRSMERDLGYQEGHHDLSQQR